MSENSQLEELIAIASRPTTVILMSGTGEKLLAPLLGLDERRILRLKKKEPEFTEVLAESRQIDRSFDHFLAIGGGSVIDFAKSVLFFSRFREKTRNLGQERLVSSPIESIGVELTAVPTTIGSGAEVSSSAVLWDGNRKIYAVSPSIKPSRTLYLPNFVDDSRERLVPGFFDILGHAIEALLSKTISFHSQEKSARAIRYVLETRDKSLDLSARYSLQLAGRWAGDLQEQHLVSFPHAVAHTMPKVPHGIGVGFSLLYFLKFLCEQSNSEYTYIEETLAEWDVQLNDVVAFLNEMVESKLPRNFSDDWRMGLNALDSRDLSRDPCRRNSRIEIDGQFVDDFQSFVRRH